MNKHINVDKLLNRLPDDLPYKASVKRVLMQTPEADVVEVRHGEWINKTNDIYYGVLDPRFDCSVCGHIFWHSSAETYNYCPACGAKMDGERSNNNDR